MASLYKRPKKAIFHAFLRDCFGIFLYIWPLARPNIAKRELLVWKKLREGFGMGSGWLWDGFGMGLEAVNFGNAGFWRLKAPETSISGA